MKDVELILRFLALFEEAATYEKPMKTFLNKYMAAHEVINDERERQIRELFEATVTFIHSALGDRAFKPLTAFNAAVFDSVMVGTARRLARTPAPPSAAFKEAYDALINERKFIAAYGKATSDKESVTERLRLATEAFERI
jgi:hypothetical protein